ncbi:hypothetical protein [Dokdonella sp.]|uniref:hypothetical protein n=1 Tax=Dokdonella sp. TaxID=2291710 RepID=UPI002DD62AFB|nr:hypothetical protein [Dokdonella sp.]
MKIYKITEASEYLGVSINTLKTLANKVTFGSCIGPIVVTVVRPGGKTPDQLRREAERRLAELLGRDDSGKIPAN